MRFESYDDKNIQGLNNILKSGNHVFILVYMDGCMPCNLMKPNWHNIRHNLNNDLISRDDISIVDVEKDYLPEIESIGSVEGFPTIKYINSSKGEPVSYEGSRDTEELIDWIKNKINDNNEGNDGDSQQDKDLISIVAEEREKSNKDKGLLSIEDIEDRVSNKSSKRKSSKKHSSSQNGGKRKKTQKARKNRKSRKVKKNKKHRKWSLKYKKSINCKKPKGFSQKQYCKY